MNNLNFENEKVNYFKMLNNMFIFNEFLKETKEKNFN